MTSSITASLLAISMATGLGAPPDSTRARPDSVGQLTEPRYTLELFLRKPRPPYEDRGLLCYGRMYEGEEPVVFFGHEARTVWNWITPYVVTDVDDIDGVPNPFCDCEIRLKSPHYEGTRIYRVESWME